MSVERDGSLTRFCCDGEKCRASYEVTDETFQVSWIEARDAGWVNAHDRGTWTHYCEKCKRELGDD